MSNLVSLFKPKKEISVMELKNIILYKLEKEFITCESFEDYNKVLVALSLVVIDVAIGCGYSTGKLIEPKVFSEQLESLMGKLFLEHFDVEKEEV